MFIQAFFGVLFCAFFVHMMHMHMMCVMKEREGGWERERERGAKMRV